MKKNLKVLALALASTGMLLTSCGDDVIYPSLDHSDNKIVITDKSGAFNKEELDRIYEKLHDSSTHGQEVRDIIMDSVADQVIGSFKIKDGDIQLVGYDVKDDGSATTDAEKLAFVETHNAYWNKKETEGKLTPTKPTAIDDEIKNRITVIKNIVREEIVTKLFDEANSDLYKEHHVFSEVKFAREKFKTSTLNAKSKAGKTFSYEETSTTENIYDKKWEKADCEEFHNDSVIDSKISKEDPESITTKMLHLDYYEDYVNKEILPSIIDTLLVEQYVYDNQYVSLSRTQARKVNFVSIQATEKTNDKAQLLINNFVNNKINNVSESEPSVDFDILADAWKGIPTTASKQLLSDTGAFTLIDSHDKAINVPTTTESEWFGGIGTKLVGHDFYKETEFGQLMLDYAKINDNKNDAESNSKQKDFSNSGKYSVTKGLEYKYKDILVKDYTTEAWGTKDNGFSSLPSNIKDTLFEYSVSTDVKVTPEAVDSKIRTEGHVVLYKGHYFLKNPKTPSNPKLEDLIVHYDSGSKTFYIVEILEALSQAKLSYSGTGAYESAKREEISREIGYDIASTDTYKNTAYNKYLEACKIEYHDQSIYDYMKETYPDLFEEEK